MTYTQGLETKDDHSLLRRAVRERWPIGGATRKRCLTVLEAIVSDPLDLEDETKTKNQMESIKTIVAIDRLNLKQEEIATPQQHMHEHLHLFADMTEEQLRVQLLKEREHRQLADLSEENSQAIHYVDAEDIDVL